MAGNNNYSYWGMNNQSQLNQYRGKEGLAGLLYQDYDRAAQALRQPPGNLNAIFNQVSPRRGLGYRDIEPAVNSAIDSINPAGGLAGITRKVGKRANKIFENKTDLPDYDDMLNNPEYFAKAKNKKGNIIWMSPDEYIERSAKGFAKVDNMYGEPATGYMSFEDRLKNIVATRKDTSGKYAEVMKNMTETDKKFPMVMLDYAGNYTPFGQEGLHRAFAAKEAGYSQIPVLIRGTNTRKANRPRTPSAQLKYLEEKRKR